MIDQSNLLKKVWMIEFPCFGFFITKVQLIAAPLSID